MATALPILDIPEPCTDPARKTVFIKLHIGLLGNSRKVSSSQVEVDADKELIRVAKTPLDSPELQAIRTLDGDVRRFLYDMFAVVNWLHTSTLSVWSTRAVLREGRARRP